MPALAIRTDLSATELRLHAKREKNPRVARRLLALANALDGMSRELAARLAGMDRQALRDWVIRLKAATASGDGDRPPLRIVDVSRLIEERTGVRYSISGAHRLMKSLNLSHQKTRPQHPQADPRAQRAFKKSSRSG